MQDPSPRFARDRDDICGCSSLFLPVRPSARPTVRPSDRQSSLNPLIDGHAVSVRVPLWRSSNPKEYQMTELKLSTTADVVAPVEKIVPIVREEVKVPAVELPQADGNRRCEAGEVPKVAEPVRSKD